MGVAIVVCFVLEVWERVHAARSERSGKGTVEVQDESRSGGEEDRRHAPFHEGDERVGAGRLKGTLLEAVALRLQRPAFTLSRAKILRHTTLLFRARDWLDLLNLVSSCVVVVNWARKTYVRRVTVTSQRVDLPCACCIALSLLYDYCLHQGRKRVRNSQLQRLLSRPFSSRFG